MISDFFKIDNFTILLIFFGSILAIIGAFLLNHKNSQESKILLRKVETSIEKSENAINHITGGDSWCYYDVRLYNIFNEHKVLVKQDLTLVLKHDGIYPIPEVHIKFYELVPDPTNSNSHQLITIYEGKRSWLGMDGFNPNQILNLELNDKLNVARYQVDFGAPNGAITQEIIFKKDILKKWHYATKVERLIMDKTSPDELNRRPKQGRPQTLYQYIDKNFPDKNSLGWSDFKKGKKE